MTPTLYNILMTLFLIIAVMLILVVLVQRGRGGGLIGAFGGPGGSSAFGAKTGDVFTIVTVIMAVLFLVIACLLAFRPAPPPLAKHTDQSARQTTTTDQPPSELPVDLPDENEKPEETPSE